MKKITEEDIFECSHCKTEHVLPCYTCQNCDRLLCDWCKPRINPNPYQQIDTWVYLGCQHCEGLTPEELIEFRKEQKDNKLTEFYEELTDIMNGNKSEHNKMKLVWKKARSYSKDLVNPLYK